MKGGPLRKGGRDTRGVSGLDCTIIVAGELGETFEEAFAGLALGHEAGTTRISGAVTDQAELQGVLRQVFDLGLQILSVSVSISALPIGARAREADSGGFSLPRGDAARASPD